MLEIGTYLNEPVLVARFQRMCGIEGARSRRPSCDEDQNNTPVQNKQGNGHSIFHENATNGFSNGHTNGYTNGHAQNGNAHTLDELKHRNIHGVANGHNQNGDCGDRDEAKLNGHTKDSPQNGTTPTTRRTRTESTGCTQEEYNYAVENNWLFYLFHLGANLGNEVFYITFYPWLIWNVDGFLGRRVCVFWALFMYLGQATKDIICWPRPSSPPVFRLEKRYALEYGMPSTHAMVGAGMPFCLLYLTTQRYLGMETAGLIISIVWCTIVCFSRIYLGMHSFLDVIAGLVYVFLLLPPYFFVVDSMDRLLVSAWWAPLPIVLVPLVALVNYPKLDRWSTARGDTTLIVGTATGVMLGYWLSNQLGLITAVPQTELYPMSGWTWPGVGIAFLRILLGGALLVFVRQAVKSLSLTVTCAILGKDKNDELTRQSLAVELPTKFISYISIALACIVIAPQIFVKIGIDRPSFFIEM